MFENRKDAGRRLGDALLDINEPNLMVLAVPKGGIEVGIEVALRLGADFSVFITRKLPYPHDPESGFGAIAEDGTVHVIESAAQWIREEHRQRIIETQRREVERRIAVLRHGAALPSLQGRTVILTDDGIAMGSTMAATAIACRNLHARHVIIAAPVASSRAIHYLTPFADRLIVLESPPGFHAVAESYKDWYDVSDEEALELLDEYEKSRKAEG